MCTVTFIARKNGYAVGMNRDEKLSRAQGLPPAKHIVNGRAAIFPSEPSGGTWIGVNDAGVTFALINWYSVSARVSGNVVSRGEVARSLLAYDGLSGAEKHLADFPLRNTNPFRLLGIFPESTAIVEWRWNLSALERIAHEWKTNIWISSGFDELGAQRTRFQTFVGAEPGLARSGDSLRALHSSHAPSRGPYSICMHRADAATVSYAEVQVNSVAATLAYKADAPCERRAQWNVARLAISCPGHLPVGGHSRRGPR